MYCVNLAKLKLLFLRFDIPVCFWIWTCRKRNLHKAWKAEVKYNSYVCIQRSSEESCFVAVLLCCVFDDTQVISDLLAHFVGLMLQPGQKLIQLPRRSPPSASSSPGLCAHAASEPSKPASSTDHWHHRNWRFGGGKR